MGGAEKEEEEGMQGRRELERRSRKRKRYCATTEPLGQSAMGMISV